MFKKILSLSNIGKFNNFEQKKDFAVSTKANPNNCNIIFGFNGSGKSTISNILSLYGSNSFTTDKSVILEQITKNSNEATNLKLELLTGSKLEYSPALSEHPVYVFNSNFVSVHISETMKKFNGSTRWKST